MMPPYPGFAHCDNPPSQVMQWSHNVMEALGLVVVPVFIASLPNPSVSQSIPVTEALVCIKNSVHLHLMAQCRYHTKAMIEYMEKNLEEFDCHKVIFSQFGASEFTKNVSEAWRKLLTLDKLEEPVSDPGWNNLSAAAKYHHIAEDRTQITPEAAQHLVNESYFNFVKMHFLNHFSGHIHKLGNLINARSQHPARAMMHLKQAYQQSNREDAAFQNLRTKARKDVSQYCELHANSGKHHRNNEIPLIQAPIHRTM